MDVRYYLDPDTGLPHIHGHGVTEEECEHVLRHPGEDLPGRDDFRQALVRRRPGDTCGSSTCRTTTRRAACSW